MKLGRWCLPQRPVRSSGHGQAGLSVTWQPVAGTQPCWRAGTSSQAATRAQPLAHGWTWWAAAWHRHVHQGPISRALPTFKGSLLQQPQVIAPREQAATPPKLNAMSTRSPSHMFAPADVTTCYWGAAAPGKFLGQGQPQRTWAGIFMQPPGTLSAKEFIIPDSLKRCCKFCPWAARQGLEQGGALPAGSHMVRLGVKHLPHSASPSQRWVKRQLQAEVTLNWTLPWQRVLGRYGRRSAAPWLIL